MLAPHLHLSYSNVGGLEHRDLWVNALPTELPLKFAKPSKQDPCHKAIQMEDRKTNIQTRLLSASNKDLN